MTANEAVKAHLAIVAGDDDLVRVLVALSLSAVAVTAVFVGLLVAGLDRGEAGGVDTMPLALIFSTVALGVLGLGMAALQNERRSRLYLPSQRRWRLSSWFSTPARLRGSRGPKRLQPWWLSSFHASPPDGLRVFAILPRHAATW
ncbi:MAG: hypothetical protein ABI726_00920 [bacterium]